MKSRTRTRVRTGLAGNLLWNPPNGYAGPFPYQYYYKEITDFTDKTRRDDGSLPPSDLYLFEESSSPIFGSYLQTNVAGNYIEKRGNDLPCSYRGTGKNFVTASQWASIETMSETELVAKLLAETNPFRYEVSVPIMIGELTEAASLLMVNVSNAASLLGSVFLNWEFGYKPMMADIKKLANITSSIESRVKEFNSLVKNGGLRRKLTLQKGHREYTGSGGSAWSTYGFSMGYSSHKYNIRSEVYGSVRWRPKRGKEIELKGLSDFNKAAAIVLDMQLPDPSTIWELIPFSWLVDYFVNVGPTLQALEKSDLVEPYDICIMRHRWVDTTTYLIREKVVKFGSLCESSGSDGQVKQQFKLRKVVAPPSGYTSLLAFGFITENQALNILALLAALRRRK